MSPRLYLGYLARRTLTGALGLFAIVGTLIAAVTFIEALREVGRVEGAGFAEAGLLALMRTPQTVLSLAPFVLLFGTLWAYGQMAKKSEVSVMRAAGLSIWRLVLAPVVLSVGLGLLIVTTLDPVAARLEGGAQTYKDQLKGVEGKMLKAFRDGVWLRQADGRLVNLIRADAFDPSLSVLSGVTVWRRTTDGALIERLDADTASVTPGAFVLEDVTTSRVGSGTGPARARAAIPVSIDLRALREDRAKPSSLSVWSLPEMIEVIDAAGLRTTSYRIRYHDLWALPLELAAMALIGCAFAIGIDARGGGAMRLVGLGVGTGFLLFIVSELSAAVAEAAIVPVALAAWAPAVLAVLFAAGLLLFREDG